MATLPSVTTISSAHFEESTSRLPFLSGEALSFRYIHKQRLPNVPISHPKQNASFSLSEKAVTWKTSAMAASAPQMHLPVATVEAETLDSRCEELADEEIVVGESSLFDWNSQWYPVSLVDDLDRRVPTAVSVMGRHLVVLWDSTAQSWQVWKDTGPEMPASRADAQINGRRVSGSSSSIGSLESRSQNDQAVVYPSVEQDGLLWFWPDSRPDSGDIVTRKPPPSIPVYTDPAFKDKLYAMNLPYGYKKMIENLLEPAYVPFAHDDPQEDFLQDFEIRLSSAVGYPLNRPSRVNKAKLKQHGLGKINGSTQASENIVSKSTKSVKNGRINAKLELAPGCSTNGCSKTNGSVNASLELPPTGVQNGGPGSSTSINGAANGTANEKVETLYEAAQSGAPDNGRAQGIELLTLNSDEAVRGDSDNKKLPQSDALSQEDAKNFSKTASWDSKKSSPQLSEGGLQHHMLEDLGRKEVISSDRVELVSKSSSSRSEATASSSHPSVVVKKPVTSRRLTLDKDVSEERAPFNLPTTGSERTLTVEMSKDLDVGGLHLRSGVQALRLLIAQKKFELAKVLAKELYEKYPCDTDVLMEYAFIEKQLGDLVAAGSLYSQAISAYEAQQNLSYDYVRALQALGSIEARARNAKRARVLFMESIRAARQAEHYFPHLIGGASVYGLHAWARLEEQLGNWGKARELLVRAAEIQPGNAVVHQSRALLEAKAENCDEARHHFLRAVESAPKDVKCWHAWAIFEASQEKYEKMRELFQRALEVDPKSVYCLQAWAHQETLIGTPESKDKARFLFQRCIQVERKNLFAWQAWAVMEKNSGNYDKARELFEKCLEISSSSVACLQAYANMERHLKNWGAALRLLRKALKLEPENAAVLMEAAFVENSSGNPELAERLFVLAGMVDKRKSRVRNKILASRKEVMQSEASEKGRSRTLIQTHRKPSKAGTSLKAASAFSTVKQERRTETSTVRQLPLRLRQEADEKNFANFQVTINAMKTKQKELKKNIDAEKRPSFHSKQKSNKPTSFQVAIDALKDKQREFRSSFKAGRRHLKREESKGSTNFQTAIEALEMRRRELIQGTEKTDALSVYLREGERAPSMLGA